ncbi:MAG: hypothetical protein GYB64_16770, partial [Chloroflexi bacterium]|nr:hypothetical protein [Chloroflexota bacterium]
MQATLNRLDGLISRVLFVTPEAHIQPETDAQSENTLGLSLAFSATRCIIQYMVLPFLLPVIGLAGAFAVGITTAINIVAIAALVGSLRRMWRINYKHKWRYFALAAPAFVVLVVFLAMDVIALAA